MATTFPLFAQLPTELRWRIWDLSASPREVLLTSLDWVRKDARKPPAAFHVYRESRMRLLQSYDKVRFPCCERGWLCEGPCQYIWIDFVKDTIHVDVDEVENVAKTMLCEKIRQLITSDVLYHSTPTPYLWEFLRWLPRFSNLQRLHLRIRHPLNLPVFFQDHCRDMMQECYEACLPIKFDLHVHHERRPDDEPLTRDNYQRIFLENDVKRWHTRKAKRGSDEPKPTVYIPRRTHHGCQCPESEYPADNAWRFRPEDLF